MAGLEKADPVGRAGLRASLMRQTQRIVPVVVIVRDEGAYLDAISSWEGPVRFPILFDDGTVQARENIGRFVRKFKPEQVLEHQSRNTQSFAPTRAGREVQIHKAYALALKDHSGSWEETFDELHADGVYSPGVVVTDANDKAWAGALALAAGRIQQLVFVQDVQQPRAKNLTPEQGDLLETTIEQAVESKKLRWREIGDEVDAITLALNISTRIKTGAKARDSVAITDRIGRMDRDGSGARWAYAGQIIGTTEQCVYQAMCALFLEIDSAFLWDGYTDKKPWVDYDMTATARELASANLSVEVHDMPNYKIDHWRMRMLRAVDASLVMINSKGSQTRFDLPHGPAWPGDLPVFRHPVMIHMVHSFSMQTPTSERTIGGRLLARGVYAYAGSVDEPYLNAFVPSPLIARRLVGSMNFGVAVRYDNGKVWKIAVLGDPLITTGVAGARLGITIDNKDFVDLKERVSERVKEQDFEGAISDLVMLGRDHDAARLAKALMADRPEVFTGRCALAAIPALFRDWNSEEVVSAFERLEPEDRLSLRMQDFLWFSSRALLARKQDYRVEALLRANLRAGQELGDAEELARFIRRRSVPDAVAVLESLRITLSEGQRTMLDRAIKRIREN